jgi:arylsulfatase A-like enzyme
MLYEASVRVPLIAYYPKQFSRGLVRDEFAEGVDLLPTLLDLAGADLPPGVQGRSLVPLCEGGAAANWRTSAFAEYEHRKMLRVADWKLVHHSGRLWGELYDLRSDPHEIENRYDDAGYAGIRSDLELALLDRMIQDERFGSAPRVLGQLIPTPTRETVPPA